MVHAITGGWIAGLSVWTMRHFQEARPEMGKDGRCIL